MPILQLAAPCWVLEPEPVDGFRPHFTDMAAAVKHLVQDYDPDTRPKTRCLPTGCWVVSCDGPCGDRLEDDEGGNHAESLADAERYAVSLDWVVDAGTDFGVYCPDCAPADVRPLVLEQIPGQLDLLDLVP